MFVFVDAKQVKIELERAAMATVEETIEKEPQQQQQQELMLVEEPAAAEAEKEDDLDGFTLYSQPAYERIVSQTRAGDEATPLSQAHLQDDDDDDGEEERDASGDHSSDDVDLVLPLAMTTTTTTTTTRTTTTRGGGVIAALRGTTTTATTTIKTAVCIGDNPQTVAVAATASSRAEEEQEEGSRTDPTLITTSRDGVDIDSNVGCITLAGSAHSHTPAVHSVDRVQLNSGGPSGVFPIFRSKKDVKTIYIIRHGESEFNRAISMSGSKWEDPEIYDAPLTIKGRHQALELRKQIASWKLPEDAVWVTSPLSRAIETMMLAFPKGQYHQQQQNSPNENSDSGHNFSFGGGGGGGSGSGVGSNNTIATTTHSSGAAQCWNEMYGNVVVLPEISERVMTSGDIGRSPSELSERFPHLRPQLSALPPVWWHDHPKKRNCPYLRKFDSRESSECMQKRVTAFRKWILGRPESVFVAVGHSVFWKAFATKCKCGAKQESLKNCGYMQLHI